MGHELESRPEPMLRQDEKIERSSSAAAIVSRVHRCGKDVFTKHVLNTCEGPFDVSLDETISFRVVRLHFPPEPPTSLSTRGRHNQYVSTLRRPDHSAGTYRLSRPSVSLIEAAGDIWGRSELRECRQCNCYHKSHDVQEKIVYS
jgi:hypothetical protein